jgi:CheY-like chemotaxis protein
MGKDVGCQRGGIGMQKRLTTIFSPVRDQIAEGASLPDEVQEPVSPGRTSSIPVVRPGGVTAPAAETGLIPQVHINHREGIDLTEAQDAGRTTEEAQVVFQKVSEFAMANAPSVLIIEDTIELAEVIQATLERMNMTTVHETHGSRGIQRFKDMQPDVVLLDIGLPDMSGWKFLESIKASQTTDLPIIIVITAYGDPANRLVAKFQGVYDYLIKPFTADDVEKVVASALRSKTA